MTKFLKYAVENASSVKTLIGEPLYDFKNRSAEYRNNNSLKHTMVINLRLKFGFIDKNRTKKKINDIIPC